MNIPRAGKFRTSLRSLAAGFTVVGLVIKELSTPLTPWTAFGPPLTFAATLWLFEWFLSWNDR